jgi:ubiquitin-conjugating enzyme E2 M
MLRFKNKEEATKENQVSNGFLQFKKESSDFKQSMIPQAKLIFNDNDILNFSIIYTPEKDSYWYPGEYQFSFKIPDDYPFSPPKVLCLTKIFHPNIDLKGNVCLNILKEDWKPTLNMSAVAAGVYFLFYDPNPKDPLNHEAAEIMRDDLKKFIDKVKISLKGGEIYGETFIKFIK